MHVQMIRCGRSWSQAKRQFSCGSGGGQIEKVFARQIFDSRGNPTVEVEVTTGQGLFRVGVPSGASTGVHEALELRDEDKKNYLGKSVFRAVDNVNTCIAPMLLEKRVPATQQEEIDKLMIQLDGTENKSKLGANAILGVSMAVCKAGAAARDLPVYQHIAELAATEKLFLPVPSMNVINGGSHAGNKLAVQEFMIMPTGASSFTEAMKMGSEVYHHLKSVIKKKYGLAATGVGDEGGFAPDIQDAKDGLSLISEAIKAAGHEGKVDVAVDVAASEFYKEGMYDLDFKNPKSDKAKWLKPDQHLEMLKGMIAEFKLVSVEDPFDQDHWDYWPKITSAVDAQIVADDLTVTNPARIKKAIENKCANCLLLKVNQIGTLTESILAHQMARRAGWGTMVSHRSGETADNFIADLVVGLGTGQIKTGAPCRSERLAKYNQLLRIEEEMGKQAVYAGRDFRYPGGGKKDCK